MDCQKLKGDFFMIEKNIVENAVKLKNQDETERLEMKKQSIDAQFSSADVKNKDLIREEQNRISDEINESTEKEKNEL
jgi:hypothetical protein